MNEHQHTTNREKKIYVLLIIAIFALVIGSIGIIATISLHKVKQGTNMQAAQPSQLAPSPDQPGSSAMPLGGSSGTVKSPQ